jgi:hypothetical protein
MIRYIDKKDKVVYDHKIILENIFIQRYKRTTLMLGNIPNKYTLQNLIDEIIINNQSFSGKFDYKILLIDYEVDILILDGLYFYQLQYSSSYCTLS